MSTCSCGFDSNNIPKPVEEVKYSNIDEAHNKLYISNTTKKKYNSFEFFLFVVLLYIIFTMIKDTNMY